MGSQNPNIYAAQRFREAIFILRRDPYVQAGRIVLFI